MDFLTDPIFSEFGRSDFIGGIDNEALDFGPLEAFIHVPPPPPGTGPTAVPTNGTEQATSSVSPNTPAVVTVVGGNNATAQSQSHLPESPPDSGSEPPYSPADLQGLTLTANTTSMPTPTGGGGGGGGGGGKVNNPVNGNRTGGPQSITLSHSITAVQAGHGTAIPTPGTPQQADLTSDITTLTDISQASIELNGVTDLHHHTHHNHHLLTSHHHTQPPPHTHHPGALYIRTDQATEQQNNQNGTITIRKHEDMLLDPHPADPQLILTQPTVPSTMLELERNYHTQQNLLTLGPAQINTEDLSRLMPEVYNATHPTTTPPITIPTRTNLSTPICRKRKLSQPDNGPPIVKPEPGPLSIKSTINTTLQMEFLPKGSSSLSPICQQHLDPGSPVSTNISTMNSTLSIPETSLDGSVQNADTTDPCPLQCIRFSPFQQQNWHVLCDQSLQELPVPHYRVDADKGFNFSNSDDAFVCQKKNHFQITCHAQLQGAAIFVRTSSGLEKIKSFHLHFYGVKLEAPNQTIRVEQSQSDRSKKPFHPVPIDLQNRLVSKVTVGRLHFSETTSNNMRKKGRPNPEQRYFQLVVGLHAHTHSGHFPVVSQGSERIIVRASNPGQFESDVELCWQRGVTQDSIYHAGRVGINTDRPDDSLVVHGNIKVSGHIVQPSDSRAKQEIGELDTSEQLKNLQKIRVVKYRYEPEFAIHSGLKTKNDGQEIIDTGVIAQEVREVLPDAVQEAGSIVLPSGQVIENFLLVNKDRILMENIGAVKELCKVTGSLETRIEQLEKINSRLMRIQQLDKNHNCSAKKCKHLIDGFDDENEEICSNKTIQMIIIVLVIIMAICLAAISTLYFVEHSKQRERFFARYDRYDYSQYISHDSILINSNTDNRNGYHIDLRHQTNSLVNPFTSRPPQTAPDTSPSTNEDQQDVLTYRQLVIDKIANSKTVKSNLNVHGLKWSPTSAESSPSGETSSEKVSETLLLPQDVDNNSIDGETQKPGGGGGVGGGSGTSNVGGGGVGGGGGSSVGKNSGKTILQNHKQHNDSYHIEFNKELPPITNKSRADTEDTDLQDLNNNSDSEDQVILEISSVSTTSKTISWPKVGVPDHCENSNREIVECQSACCEDTNNLSVHVGENEPTINNSFEVTFNQNGSTNKGHSLNIGQTNPILINNQVQQQKSIQKPIDEQPVELRDPETLIGGGGIGGGSGVNGGNVGGSSDIVGDKKLRKPTDAKRKVVSSNNGDHKPTADCFPMALWLRSESLNVSLGSESFCRGHNLNMSYSIPISKFMRETKIEIHFVGSTTLQWSLCSNKQRTIRGYTTKESSDITNIVENGKIFPRNPNKYVFYFNLPIYGFFEHQFEFRASLDPIKNACQEQPDDTSNLFQYNIRIFRDCD